MPKIKYSLKAIRRHYAKGLEKGMIGAIYEAYSKWNKRALNLIHSTAPVTKTPTQEFPKGFVKRQIRLVTRKRGAYRYQEVDVPTKFQIGSPGWRAWLIIKALHFGWKKLPFERRPRIKKALGLPVMPGARVPRPGQTKIAVKKVVQKRQITLNPWILRVWKQIEPEFPDFLTRALDSQKRVQKTLVRKAM